VDEILRRPGAVLTGRSGNSPIVRPLRPPFRYRLGMEEYYLRRLAERIEDLPNNCEVSVLVISVLYDTKSMHNFLTSFFPFALTASVPAHYPERFPRERRREELVAFVNRIVDCVSNLRSRARAVRDYLSGRNFTSLLLPIRNFRSTVLTGELRSLFESLSSVGDARAELARAEHDLQRVHPLRRAGKGTLPFFEDARNLRFKSPGQNRHGMARRVAGDHKPQCLIGSRVRFGGPYDPLFHYDCEYEGGGASGLYPNCHDAECTPAAATHVNIAPNDAIR
jgi:hypothetical protein